MKNVSTKNGAIKFNRPQYTFKGLYKISLKLIRQIIDYL